MDKHKKFHIGVKALIVNEGKILLFQINPEHVNDKARGAYWDIPGGRIEANDTALETLKRELQEEAGISDFSNPEFFHASIANIEIPTSEGVVGLALFIYKVRINPDQPITISSEHINYEWFEFNKAAELLSVKYPPDFTDKIKNL